MMNGVNGQQMNHMVNGPMVQNGMNGYHTIHLNQAMAAQLQQSQHVSPVPVQPIQMLAGSGPKNGGALNAGAAPFLLSSKGMISPPLSAQMNQMALPHPQSFAFPPPPLPQHALHAHTNWLPVPAAPVNQQQPQ